MTGFDSAHSYAAYDGRIRKLIHLLKYDGMRPLSRNLGEFLSLALPRDEHYDLIVPLPLHWWRRWRRGFNQAELLAQELSRRTGIPMSNAMRRVKPTPPQAGLSRAQRRENVAGAFRVSRKEEVRDRSVLLIDDVLTTGATAGACAAALRRAGARRTTVLTVARVDRRAALVAQDSLSTQEPSR